MNALHSLVGFLHVLTNADEDGRIIVDSTSGSLKFVLLNAAAHFSKVRIEISSSVVSEIGGKWGARGGGITRNMVWCSCNNGRRRRGCKSTCVLQWL